MIDVLGLTPGRKGYTMQVMIAGTTIEVPDGAVLRHSMSHPILGLMEAQFTLQNTVGDGRPGDGEQYVWKREAVEPMAVNTAPAPASPRSAPLVVADDTTTAKPNRHTRRRAE